MALSYVTAVAVSIWVEVLLYGVYTCLFLQSLYIMIKKRNTSSKSAKVFLFATILMYIIATIHIGVNLYRFLRGFVWGTSNLPYYLASFTMWENIVHNFFICIMTWLGDALVIYRCFVIWNNNIFVIIIPVILLILSISSNAIMLFWFTHPGSVTFETLLPWMNTIYPFAFVQNVLTTGMIAFKIWRQHRRSTASGLVDISSPLHLMAIMRIVVESAMVYTIQLLILIILYPLRHNAQFIVQSAVVPSIGTVFVLIAVRVHFTQSRALFEDTVMTALPTWFNDSESNHSIGPTTFVSDESRRVQTIDGQRRKRRSEVVDVPFTTINVNDERRSSDRDSKLDTCRISLETS